MFFIIKLRAKPRIEGAKRRWIEAHPGNPTVCMSIYVILNVTKFPILYLIHFSTGNQYKISKNAHVGDENLVTSALQILVVVLYKVEGKATR